VLCVPLPAPGGAIIKIRMTVPLESSRQASRYGCSWHHWRATTACSLGGGPEDFAECRVRDSS
jgi:hypothetical protein